MEAERVAKRQQFRTSLQDVLKEHSSHVDTLEEDQVDRYMEARKWEVAAAVEMAKEAETWHLRVRPKQITPADISRSLPSGCWRFAGKALDGRPILLIRAALWRPSSYTVEEYVRYVAYMTEGNLARITPLPPSSSQQQQQQDKEGEDSERDQQKTPTKHMVMFDMAGFSLMHSNMRMLQHLIRINQMCYPERLSLAIVFNAPAAFVWVFGVLQPWIDPNTREKIHFFAASASDMERYQVGASRK
jgi:hypothetical protein